MMRQLKLMALLVHGFLLTSILGDHDECPLLFQDYRNLQANACAEAKNGDFESSACCVGALVSYTQALAYHTNTTSGQPLFLNAAEQAACADKMSREKYIDRNECSFQPPKFTAYASPCLFGYSSELLMAHERVLPRIPSEGDSRELTGLAKACSNVELVGGCSDCRTMFTLQQKLLAADLNDSELNCGLALLVSLVSYSIKETDWLQRFYWCLEVPFTAAPALPGRKSTLLVPLLLTSLATTAFLGFLVLLVHLRKKFIPKFNNNGSDVGNGEDPENDISKEFVQMLASDVPVVSQGSLYTFSYKELTMATDNFSSKNFIGEGSAGKVFKGALPSGQLVAIKHIMNEKKLDTFYKEVENLSKVRHANLVTLLGYCQTPNEHLLVYEYCSKGNLWHYLFGSGPILTWEQRINIAVGSARGIWYLHLYPGGYIVHRDIKPTNILLNEHMEAKVSDFGLSRFIAIEESRVFTEVKGTAGYLDPEYLSLGTLTFASDVYSFGIVLLELISGRRPIELSLNLTKRLPLVKLAILVVERGEDLSQLVDPRLEGCYSKTAFNKITELAVQCTSESAAVRPSMSTVLQRLEEAWRVARLESPPQRTLRRTPTTASGSWSPVSSGTPLEDGQVWESRSFDVWESKTFDGHSTPER